MTTKKITISTLQQMKRLGEKIAALTVYDAPTAVLLNEAGIDVLLVGDSVANVKLGYANTIPVTMEEMLHHARAAARGNSNALLVVDMPYLSYHISLEETLKNAGRFIKEAGAEAVKLEGGAEISEKIKALSAIHVPVMGHLGLTPQSIHAMGGYKNQGQTESAAKKILADAKCLEQSGVFAIVLECIPAALAKKITESVAVPTIGIGAGSDCDGQILVSDDLLGLTPTPRPSFVQPVVQLRAEFLKAFKIFRQDVKGRS